MPPRALPCRPDALPFDRVVRIAVREQSTMDRDCVALFVSPRTTFLELACGCSAAAARSPAVSLRGLRRGRPTHRHLPYGAVWIDISVLVPRTARPARLSSVPVVAERPAAGSVALGGSHPKKVGFGFNSYDPRIDPRHPRPGTNDPPFDDGRPVLATGGSSSDPGIAVGANLATIGIGTETSGSILSPSGQNSLVGIKPTLAPASTRRTRPPPLARRVEYGVPRLAVTDASTCS